MIPDEEPTGAQRDEAALWFARKSGGSLSPESGSALEAWLNADARHRRAYNDIRVLYARLEAPARLVGATSPIGRRFAARLRPRWNWLFAPAALFVALFLVWLVDPAVIQNWQADIVTSRALVSALTLPDGSIADLGADTAVALDFKDGRRRVRLLRGEAYFDVRHGPPGRFTVQTFGADIQDVGTKFDVELLPDQTQVTVVDGSVEVAGSVERNPVVLRIGDQVVVKAGRLDRVRPVGPGGALAWMKGRLVVQGASVGDVVSILQRYTRAKIVVFGRVGGSEISGTFPLNDIDDSLTTVASAVGGGIVRMSSLAILLY